MIGVVVIALAPLASATRTAIEVIAGTQQHMIAIDTKATAAVEPYRKRLSDAVSQVDQGDGIIIVTDRFGSTPSNLAISLMDRPDVEVIAGMNVPMLISIIEA